MKTGISEEEDYYFDSTGLMVLTEKYLLKKGSCCGNGCRHCPYDYMNVLPSIRNELLLKRNHEDKKTI